VTGFGYDHGPAWALNNEFFKSLTDVSQGVRRLGAASIDLCHVAQVWGSRQGERASTVTPVWE